MSLARPDRATRENSFAIAGRALASHRAELRKVTYVVYASKNPADYKFTNRGDSIALTITTKRLNSGLATAVSRDGYLLTAAHVVNKYCYVVGWMDGKQSLAQARTVYRHKGGEFGQDVAILHVDRHLDSAIRLGALKPSEKDVYAFACDRRPKLHVIAVAGTILRRPVPPVGKEPSVMEMNLPLWKGDSGAAVLSREGELVGVFVGMARPLTSLKVSRVACVPDMSLIRSIIDMDRRAVEAQTKSHHAGNGTSPRMRPR